MNKDFNQMTDTELSLWLGEVLNGGSHGHIVAQTIQEMEFSYYHCKTCGKINFETDSHCPISAPIPLTPDNAFKWRDWAVEKYGEDDEGDTYFVKAMMVVYNFYGNNYGITAWLTDKAQPKHYLIAAAKLKEKTNG
jgi:hypothetical protein